MAVTTIWTPEDYPGSSKSIWADNVYPWQLPLPWQYGKAGTVWTKEY